MRRLLLSLALTLTLSAVGASSALAEAPEGAQTAPLFGPNPQVPVCEIGAEPTPKTFGFVVLDTPGDESTLTGEVALKHAAPDATYGVEVFQVSSGACIAAPLVGEITTNKEGNGNLHFTTRRFPLTTKFFVEVASTETTSLEPEHFDSPTVELD